MGRFVEQTVIVTGGARGMGASHVRGFVAEGGRVVIADVLEEEGRALAVELGPKVIFVPLDVTSEDDWTEAVKTAEDAFGPVSVLVNNAGIGHVGPLMDTDPSSWRRVIDVNLTGPYLGIRAVADSMRTAGGGSIVNISSVAGLSSYPGLGAYGASKWGLRGLSKYAALELARDGIRVNSIHPGFVETRLLDSIDGLTPEAFPVPRLATPEEITKLVLFVASDDAAYSTGDEFTADGGTLLGPAPRAELAVAGAA
jgi:3alpha(or 20beta)-hydroxysteroid dehydrogenase